MTTQFYVSTGCNRKNQSLLGSLESSDAYDWDSPMSSEISPTVERDGGVAIVTLNRPDRLNAFDGAQTMHTSQVMRELALDRDVRVVVVTGAGRGFSAGADLAARGGSQFADTEEALLHGYKPAMDAMMQMPKPVICAVNGPAAGVGAAFALAGDLCVMDEKAYVMLAFANIALIPDGGANYLFVRALGYRRAYEAAISASKIGAEECKQAGIANKIAPAGTSKEVAIAWAKELETKAPASLRHTKELMRRAENETYDAIYRAESARQNTLIGAPDNREGVTAFMEKRAPQFQG